MYVLLNKITEDDTIVQYRITIDVPGETVIDERGRFRTTSKEIYLM